MTSTKTRPALNGVDVPTLFATLDAVKAQPDIAQFQFRARNEWISGTHNRSTIAGFYGAGQEDTSRTRSFTFDADHPAVLVGNNNAPTAVEFLLHAIAACLTSGLANIAAVRGVQLHRVSSTVEGAPCSPKVRKSCTQVALSEDAALQCSLVTPSRMNWSEPTAFMHWS